MDKDFSELTSRTFKEIFLRAKESPILTIVIIFFVLVFAPPLITYLQKIISSLPYGQFFFNIISFFQNNFNLIDYVFLILFITLFIFFWRFKKQLLKTKTVTEKFKDEELSNWSIPAGHNWTTERCEDFTGKMLGVTSSSYPGILKAAYGWYDYEISFMAKMSNSVEPKNRQNIGVVVRSENSLNGILLQITKNMFIPHLLYNESYIKDSDNSVRLKTVLKENIWLHIKIIVKGNNIKLLVDNYPLNYTIPTLVFNNVATNLLRRGETVTLKQIKESDDDITKRQFRVVQEAENIEKMTEGPEKENRWAKLSQDLAKVPASTRIVLEYQKGSVGFRESGPEHTYFRNLIVKKR